MGGSIAVAIRESDGTEHRMTRWTNSLPWGICNNKMLSEDRGAIDQYLDQWLSMKSDWDLNNATGKFKFPMTECYLPGPGLVPVEYGLVVLDFKTNTILSHQGYTSLDKMLASSINLEIQGGSWNDKDSDFHRALDFFKAGKIKTASIMGKDGLEDIPIPSWLLDTPTAENLTKFIKDGCKRLFSFKSLYFLNVCLEPFNFIDYRVTDGTPTDLYLKVKELGLVLSDDEEAGWKEWIEEEDENY